MADYSITAASVLPSAGASTNDRTCGEAGGLAAGDLVYLDLNDLDTDGVGKAKKSSSGAKGTAVVDGMCLNAAALGQPVVVVNSDPALVPGCTLAAADTVIASNNSGKIAPVADLASGKFLTYLGYALTTVTMNFNPNPTGVAK